VLRSLTCGNDHLFAKGGRVSRRASLELDASGNPFDFALFGSKDNLCCLRASQDEEVAPRARSLKISSSRMLASAVGIINCACNVGDTLFVAIFGVGVETKTERVHSVEELVSQGRVPEIPRRLIIVVRRITDSLGHQRILTLTGPDVPIVGPEAEPEPGKIGLSGWAIRD
jgi:hypothetical protein